MYDFNCFSLFFIMLYLISYSDKVKATIILVFSILILEGRYSTFHYILEATHALLQ